MSKFAEEYSVYVGNLDIKVAVADLEELVHELFLQVIFSIGIAACTLASITALAKL